MKRQSPPTLLRALAAALLFGPTACGHPGDTPQDPGSDAIAHVGERAVTRRDFDLYLTSTLGTAAEVAAAGAELKSRLLDQYLDEELLTGAAMEAGLTVSDDEVKDFDPNGSDVGQAAIRRILLTRKYKQKVILANLTVSEQQIRSYFDQHLQDYQQPARVVLRQILLDNPDEASKIRQQLVKDPTRFEEIAETRSLAPDGGKPYPLEETLLPDALRKALEPMQEGHLSAVVQDPQGYYILKLEARQPETAASLDEARQRIELKLLQDLGEKKYAEFMAGLRRRTKVAIQEDVLGFPYVKRASS